MNSIDCNRSQSSLNEKDLKKVFLFISISKFNKLLDFS